MHDREFLLGKLKAGVEEWNQWRRAADPTEIDLNGAFLDDVDLSGAHLSHANLSKANLGRADLSGADLSGANLSYANLVDADLTLRSSTMPT